MFNNTPISKDLVLVGGGHAHIEVLRRFGMRPERGVRITLISREIHSPYSGMLPGLVAGHYTFDETHIDLQPLCHFAGARLYHDEVVGIDLVSRHVQCARRPPVPYDILSLDTGAAPAMDIPGAAELAIAVKPVSTFYPRWQALCERARQASGPLVIGVIGGGAGGAELLMAARAHLLSTHGAAAERFSFHLVTAGADILPTHANGARERYRRALALAGVTVTSGFEVAAVEAGAVIAADGRRIALDEILWTTHAAAPPWPRTAGLATDEAGFIRVAPTLQTTAFPDVFAAGDIATVEGHPRPKSGVFAVRQGPPLAANLRRACRGQALEPYVPQRAFLSLISTGDKHAIASRGRFSASGRWVWHWKDFIDRRFMRRYSDLPRMAETAPAGEDPSEADMRCGGCGAKLGAEVLREALAALSPTAPADILIGLGAPDDAAVVRPPPGLLAVHSVDGFRAFIDDPWMLGRVAANHALNDIYAMGAIPHNALALVTLPYAESSRMQDDLVQILRGALAVLETSATALIGGHTGEGAELGIAFAINGYVDERALVRKRGVQAGDALILTQALGTGVLFAAAMRGRARARWLDAALTAMVSSKAAAAQCCMRHGVHAMTDVTGFGLVGHLVEMLDGYGATLSLAALPLMAGAETLAAETVLSSLQGENRRAERYVAARHSAASQARYELAFDPQTAGGLLVAVPGSAAPACLAELHALGYSDSAVIGRVGATGERLTITD
ncbi:MAG: selenide, water dikinase SelD [Gammaproteobacteria bacterium]